MYYAVVTAVMRSVSLLAICLASYGSTIASHPHQPVLRLIIEKPNVAQHWGNFPDDFKLRVLNPQVDNTKTQIQTNTDENEADEEISISSDDSWDDIPIFNIENSQWEIEDQDHGGAQKDAYRALIPRVHSPLRLAARAVSLDRDRRDPTLTQLGPGMIFDMNSFFGRLQNNLDSIVSMDPETRTALFAAPPRVQSPSISQGSNGGGMGVSKLTTFRPFRPDSKIRSYNRRSVTVTDQVRPIRSRHNPSLLWMGLGR